MDNDPTAAAIERLERAMWDSRVAVSKADVNLLLNAVAVEYEVLAEGYKALSGKRLHASDCAVSCAPAEKPGPCNCDFEGDDAVARAALAAFNGGLIEIPDASNARGYTTRYLPVAAMHKAIAAAAQGQPA